VILLAVRWHLRCFLSYRDVRELLAKRGIAVDHVTIYRWQGRADTISCGAIALTYYRRMNPQVATTARHAITEVLTDRQMQSTAGKRCRSELVGSGAAHATLGPAWRGIQSDQRRGAGHQAQHGGCDTRADGHQYQAALVVETSA
jgi:hypothetical protein